MRIRGDIEEVDLDALSWQEMEKLLLPLIAEDQQQKFLSTGDLDFAISLPGIAAFSRQLRLSASAACRRPSGSFQPPSRG